MIEDDAFYRWPAQPYQQPELPQGANAKSPLDTESSQTVFGQEQLFDHSIGAPASPLARKISRLETDTAIVASATRQRVGSVSLNGANRDEQLAFLSSDEQAMQPQRRTHKPLQRPRGRISARNRALGDAARTGSFGEQ